MLQKHTTGTSKLGMKSLTASFLCCFDYPEQTRQFQCKMSKGAWVQRKVLDPLLKMLSSTLICWKLKLPVMNLLESEVSDQTGSRSMRARSLCASRSFPKKLAFAPPGNLKVFTFVSFISRTSVACFIMLQVQFSNIFKLI